MAIRRSFLDEQPAVVQLFLLLGLVIACAFVFTVVGMVLVKPFFGVSGADILLRELNDNPESLTENYARINALKLIQLLSTIGLFLVPALIFAFTKRPGGDYIQMRRRTTALWLLLGSLLVLCAAPFVGFLYDLNMKLQLPEGLMNYVTRLHEQAEAAIKLFLRMPTAGDLAFNLLLIAVLPALAEEFFFRGVVQKVVHEGTRNTHAAVWITGALFSLIHFQFLGFLPRMFLGVLLGYLFVYSGSIWVPVVGHMINNGAQVIAAYLYQHGMSDYNIEDSTAPPLVAVAASVVITALLYYVIVKRRVPEPDLALDNPPADRDQLPFV